MVGFAAVEAGLELIVQPVLCPFPPFLPLPPKLLSLQVKEEFILAQVPGLS